MSQEGIEVKVAKLETKLDTVLSEVANINRKLDFLDDKISRKEFNDFKAELRAGKFKQTMLTATFTCVITTLVGYVVIDVLGR
jgi:hypothetical protein